MGDELLKAIPDAGLSCHFIWLPVLPSDDEEAAVRNEARIGNDRAQHYWDDGLRFARHMATALGIGDTLAPDGTRAEGIAWDVYLLYPRGAATIERPAFWMHQLDTSLAPRLDAAVLFGQVRALLR